LEGAAADFDHALRLRPGYALVYNNRGIARQKHGDQAGAQCDFAIAKRLMKK
jgi:Flp pilus assembly protein TadD